MKIENKFERAQVFLIHTAAACFVVSMILELGFGVDNSLLVLGLGIPIVGILWYAYRNKN